MTDTQTKRYSKVAMLFHWVIAAAVIALWQIAEASEEAEHANNEALHIELMGYHKSLGITVLVLTVLRILWRMGNASPELPKTMKSWEVFLTKATHTFFYVLLLGLPLGGWAASSFANRPLELWGIANLPLFPVAENFEIAKGIMQMHHLGGEAIIILMFLHILGALKHTFFDKSGGLARMLPFGKV